MDRNLQSNKITPKDILLGVLFFLLRFIHHFSSIKYNVNLYQSKLYQSVIIIEVNCEKTLKKRLEKLGVFRGVVVSVIRKSALGGPVQIIVRGTYLAIRKADAEKILVEKI